MSEISGFLVAVFILFGIPITLIWMIIGLVKKKQKKVVFAPILVVFSCIIFFTIIGTCSYAIGEIDNNSVVETVTSKKDTKEEVKIEESKKREEKEEQVVFEEAITKEPSEEKTAIELKKEDIVPDNLEDNFKLAVESIGMDYSQVRNMEELERWSSGERYSFVYNGFRYIVYELDDGEIDSINTELKRTKIYERGFKPLNYKEFEPDVNMLSILQNDALMKMSEYIDGATQITIKTGSLLYDRIYDYYTISGIIKVENNIDKEEYTFSIDYLIDDLHYQCSYLALDGNVVYGEDKAPEVKKEEVIKKEVNSDSIILSDGTLGNYGKIDIFDGEEYIRYYVEEGNYKVLCKKTGGFYVETIEIKKENGYDVVDTIAQHMLKSGEETEIEIQDGQCISLIINTEIELVKK